MSERVNGLHSKRYIYWPINLAWRKPLLKGKWSPWFKTHGWQVGWDGIGMGVFGWTLHLGRLKIMFGSPNFKRKPHKQVMIPVEDR